MMNKRFLEQVATELINEYKDILNSSIVIVPNKRAKLFLLEYMREQISVPMLSPRCFSSEEFALRIADMEKEDKLPLLFQLYKVYDGAYRRKNIQPLSFDDFYFLGNVLLADFDEIDRFLVSVEKLFDHLSKLEPYEQGARTHAPVFVELWESLGEIYKEFSDKCREKKKAYMGLIYREASTKTDEMMRLLGEQGKVFWVGFYALTPAEEMFLHRSDEEKKAVIYLDVDSYFTDDPMQEAGDVYRKFWKKYVGEDYAWKDALLGQKEDTKIQIYSTTNETSMVKLLSVKLQEYLQSQEGRVDTRPDEVAIVLPKEDLLFSVLNSLPEGVRSVNVTMGFPLRATQVATWVELILRLRESARKEEVAGKKKLSFSGECFIEVLDHQYTRLLSVEENKADINATISFIREKNLSRFSLDNVTEYHLPELLQKWLETPEEEMTGQKTVEFIFSFVKSLLALYRERKLVFESEFIYALLRRVDEVQRLMRESNIPLSFAAVGRILRDVIQEGVIAFSGEPLEGWQIMGVLETQALDFSRVFLLSMNEGIMPAEGRRSSFIPADVREACGMPQKVESETVYAYHFYRLLKRSREVMLFYTKESGESGKQEKSRYLEQMLLEYPAPVEEKAFAYPVVAVSPKTLVVDKTEKVKLFLRTMVYSPTVIKTYFECSLRFYYQYVLKVREMETLEETPEARDIGNILHRVLEEVFARGNTVNKEFLKQMKERALLTPLVEKAMSEEFSLQHMQGRMLLLRNILIQRCIKAIEKHEDLTEFRVGGTEEELQTDLLVQGETIHLKGRVDRWDECAEGVRIVDYKTGTSQTMSLPLDDETKESMDNVLKELPQNINRTYVFQLVFYAYLFFKQYGKENIEVGVFSLRDYEYKPVQKKNKEKFLWLERYTSVFEEGLKNVFDKIFSNEPFQATSDRKQCANCPFSVVCGREQKKY